MGTAAHGVRLVDSVHLGAPSASIRRQISLLPIWLRLSASILGILLKLLLLLAIWPSLGTHIGDALSCAVRGQRWAKRLIFDHSSTSSSRIANVYSLCICHGRAARPSPHRDSRVAPSGHSSVILSHVFTRLV